MKKKYISILAFLLLTLTILIIFILTLLPWENKVYAESVRGVVNYPNNRPIPNVVVSIIAPDGKRLISTKTDNNGKYFFSGLPQDTRRFYLEVYWGSELIYRESFYLRGDMNKNITIK